MLTRSKRSHSFSSIQNIQGVSLEKLKILAKNMRQKILKE